MRNARDERFQLVLSCVRGSVAKTSCRLMQCQKNEFRGWLCEAFHTLMLLSPIKEFSTELNS